MPRVDLILFRETDGTVPFLEWVDGLTPYARAKCLALLSRLKECGHELRRPIADYLGDGIYELRGKYHGINFRMLYFFHGTVAVVVSHGFVKQEAKVPQREIDLALNRKSEYDDSPASHSFRLES